MSGNTADDQMLDFTAMHLNSLNNSKFNFELNFEHNLKSNANTRTITTRVKYKLVSLKLVVPAVSRILIGHFRVPKTRPSAKPFF